MNERRIDRQRYWLACFFETMPPGRQFTPGLLHLTVIPWFVSDINEAEILKSFQAKFKNRQTFSVEVGQRAWFGPKKDVPVSLIEPNDPILGLHNAAMEWFESIGARWAVKNPHSGPDYLPHIRYRQGSELASGEILKINSLTLVKARRREDGLRVVAGRVEFL